MLTDVWPVTIITRVEAFFAFLGGKGAKKNYFTYIFVIREPQSMTYQKFLHSDRVPLRHRTGLQARLIKGEHELL